VCGQIESAVEHTGALCVLRIVPWWALDEARLIRLECEAGMRTLLLTRAVRGVEVLVHGRVGCAVEYALSNRVHRVVVMRTLKET
jgi:hypothetical protein